METKIVDLSYDGCGVEAPTDLIVGQKLKLIVPGRGMIEVEVRWSKSKKAGLRFSSVPTEGGSYATRQVKRFLTSADVKLKRLGGGLNYRVRMIDLSTHGCSVELVERPRIFEQLLIRVDGLEALKAEVCWVENFIAGLKFEKQLHPAVLDLLLVRLNPVVAYPPR